MPAPPSAAAAAEAATIAPSSCDASVPAVPGREASARSCAVTGRELPMMPAARSELLPWLRNSSEALHTTVSQMMQIAQQKLPLILLELSRLGLLETNEKHGRDQVHDKRGAD